MHEHATCKSVTAALTVAPLKHAQWCRQRAKLCLAFCELPRQGFQSHTALTVVEERLGWFRWTVRRKGLQRLRQGRKGSRPPTAGLAGCGAPPSHQYVAVPLLAFDQAMMHCLLVVQSNLSQTVDRWFGWLRGATKPTVCYTSSACFRPSYYTWPVGNAVNFVMHSQQLAWHMMLGDSSLHSKIC